ncbi:MAG: GLUG motif-containing protein [Planctomycetota bacterium]
MKARFTCFALILVLMGISFAKYSGGTGEPNDPYLIATPNDLNAIGFDSNDWDKHFKMVADINLASFTGTQFNIIGTSHEYSFTGVFDGNEHSILSYAYESSEQDRVGLFGCVNADGAEIKGVTMVNPEVEGKNLVGALAGWLANGKVSRCFAQNGIIQGVSNVGGLIGKSNDVSLIDECSSSGSVSGTNYDTGGFVGYNRGTISYCHSMGTVTGKIAVGGFVGANVSRSAFVKSCSSISVVVVGDTYVGGLVGLNDAGNIRKSYAGASVSGLNEVGGFLGGSSYLVSDCYVTAKVSGTENVGGFIGTIWDGELSRCYTASTVDANLNTGGFTGSHFNGVNLKCFWNIDLEPNLDGIGNSSDPNVIGISTAQMQKHSTFADVGWDMVNVWDIGEGQTYPFLRTHLPSDINKDDETNFFDLAIQAQNWLKEE